MWAAHFGHLPPKCSTFYLSKGKQPTQPKPQAQWNTAIEPKGLMLKHSEQQNTSNPSSSQPLNATNPGSSKSKPLHHRTAQKKKASACMAEVSSDFVLANSIITIANQLALLAPTTDTVVQFTCSGLATW